MPRLPVLAAALVLAFSCSLDYGTGMVEELGQDTPDAVLVDFVHTVVEKGVPRFRLEAERGESFQEAGTIRLSNVSFVEFEAGSDAILTEGRADSAVYITATESAEMSGNVTFSRKPDSLDVESGYLRWDGEAKTLVGRADTRTTLSFEGSSLSGSGFNADASRRTFSFTRRVDGTFTEGEAP
ncbi:MAG TPA: LPS export ABC transporter periplasmic protein LptC [Spirochaetales bacterium]|nr:LPS export ABC transporter periplasmic protein LptC [Spirochaetales bacterium]MBP7262751.1 LPS export ABC transporter periplasmic protein LptC [Spirochaetia bacterium]HPE35552.1 LPS export ABC transporter periplasmic protein LptC [Spirochaetales bacterium]